MLFTVDDAGAGRRLDAFLAGAGAAPSVGAARRAIAEGRVSVDGRPAVKGTRLAAGQAVTVDDVAVSADVPALEILHEDAQVIALCKPSGIPSQSLRAGEGGTVAAALIARFPECAAASEDPREGGLAHRLDTGTSGVLLAARSREVWLQLRRSLGGGGSEKVYLAEVWGVPEGGRKQEDGALVVDAAIGRSGRRGERVRLDGGRSPQAARTEVRVRERRGETTLVEARLSVGRPHQVRAHLAHLGSPVVGDELYGASRPAADTLHLHAFSLRLPHPVTGQPWEVRAPLPAWARPV